MRFHDHQGHDHPGHGPHSHEHIAIDGFDVPFMRLPNGRLMCDLLMFQLFDSVEQLAAALSAVKGRLWDVHAIKHQTIPRIRTRRNIYDLDEAELGELVHAVNEIKSRGLYDDFVRRHIEIMVDGSNIHGGPAFLPWHRVFIYEFEQALQTISPGVSLPFWNWLADSRLGAKARLWQSAGQRTYFGGDGDAGDHVVRNGPCATWPILIYTPQGPAYRAGFGLDRRLAQDVPNLPDPSELPRVLGVVPYDADPWDVTSDDGRSFRNALEGFASNGAIAMHNRIHVWIGGDMESPGSPNDPVFFLHHAFVDCIWAEWQKRHPAESYLPERGGPPGQNVDDLMPHLLSMKTPRQTLDTRSFGYEYPTGALM